MEKELDDIAEGKLDQVKMLRGFYKPFHALIEKSGNIDKKTVVPGRELGHDPKTNRPISARVGRFGPMLQLGSSDDEQKPQFAPLPDGVSLKEVTLEQALKAFELPRLVGKTDDGQEILANIGRFGPYIKVDKLFVSIKPLDPHKITLSEARKLYAEKIATEKAKNIADFGAIKVLNGRFGPYITDGQKNARIPKDTDPKKLTEAEARKILDQTPAKKAFRRRVSR
jgi:DNA topoisomerase-1